jgi:hypothetical protein
MLALPAYAGVLLENVMRKTSDPYVSPVWDGERKKSVMLKIAGLTVVDAERGVFELEGCSPRPIDGELLVKAIGGADDELIDKIGAVIWKHDLIAILTERIQPQL